MGSLVFYGVGVILGAGIYSILGEAAGVAGEALWWSFLLGSLAALLTGLSYAELATMFPAGRGGIRLPPRGVAENTLASGDAGLDPRDDRHRHHGNGKSGLRRVRLALCLPFRRG